MVSINYSSREVCCKIVYYGPGLSGKTTNLLYVHSKVPSDTRGKMISLATEADRTLYFDFLPINIGTINGFAAKFQLYTVPGQVYYNATRKLVLRGVDGVVFVADSQPDKMEENIESLLNLEENLREYGYEINDLPMVIQYNKRDLPGVLPIETLNARINPRGLPHFGASATIGNGVFDTLKLIIKLVLEKAKRSASNRAEPASTGYADPAQQSEPAPAAPPPAAGAAPVEVSNPEPVDEPSREPVYSESPTPPGPEPASVQPVGVAASAPSAESRSQAAEPARYRPYPGSESGASEGLDKKISQASFSPAKSAEDEEAEIKPARSAVSNSDENDTLDRPAMAPSLKRRGEQKKRGFFKRLFGIK